MKSYKIPYYRQISLYDAPGFSLGIYVMVYEGTNHLIIGTYYESRDGLQKSHTAGPLVHHEHVLPYVKWLRNEENSFLYVEKMDMVGSPGSLTHPFTSAGLPVILDSQHQMQLGFGKYREILGLRDVVLKARPEEQVAEALLEGKREIWGSIMEDQTIILPLHDERFCWLSYDRSIDKIRMGLGFFGGGVKPIFGNASFVLDRNEYESWAAHHFQNIGSRVQFFGLPMSWPVSAPTHLDGGTKAGVAVAVVEFGDQIWNS